MKKSVLIILSIIVYLIYTAVPLFLGVKVIGRLINNTIIVDNVNLIENLQSPVFDNNYDNNDENNEFSEAKAPTIVEIDVKPVTNCLTKFESKYFEFSFEYDDCYWDITEKADFNEYSEIKDYELNIVNNEGLRLETDFYTTGWGGGYPGCLNAKEVMILNPHDILRVKMQGESSERYLFFAENVDYAIKGYSEENTFLYSYISGEYSQVYKNSNFCFQTVSDKIIKPKDEYKQSVGVFNNWVFTLAMEIGNQDNYDEDYLNAGNQLAVEIFDQKSVVANTDTITSLSFAEYKQEPIIPDFVNYLSAKNLSQTKIGIEKSPNYPMIIFTSDNPLVGVNYGDFGVQYGNGLIDNSIKGVFLPEAGFKYEAQEGIETLDYSVEFFRVANSDLASSKYIVGIYIVPNSNAILKDLYIRVFDSNLNEVSKTKIVSTLGTNNSYLINVTEDNSFYITSQSEMGDGMKSQEFYVIRLNDEDKSAKRIYECSWSVNKVLGDVSNVESLASCKE